jgi:hypothetical protein
MIRSEIQAGKFYMAKVNKKLTAVRVDEINETMPFDRGLVSPIFFHVTTCYGKVPLVFTTVRKFIYELPQA